MRYRIQKYASKCYSVLQDSAIEVQCSLARPCAGALLAAPGPLGMRPCTESPSSRHCTSGSAQGWESDSGNGRRPPCCSNGINKLEPNRNGSADLTRICKILSCYQDDLRPQHPSLDPHSGPMSWTSHTRSFEPILHYRIIVY